MKWHHVQENWPAFFEAIADKWPEADEAELDSIDGDQRAFVGEPVRRRPAHARRSTGDDDPLARNRPRQRGEAGHSAFQRSVPAMP